MIDVEYQGRLGNNLFQYSFARLMAEDNGVPYCMTLPENGAISSNDRDCGSPHYSSFTEVQEGFGDQLWVPPVVQGDTKYLGYFQRWGIFKGRQEQVRGFFNYNYPKDLHPGVCLHLRLTDFHEIPTLVKPQKVYSDVVDSVYTDELLIVTDDPGDPYLDYFKRRYPRVRVQTSTQSEDFRTLMSYDTLITCNSTVSWWAGYLGNSSRVFVPEDFGRGSESVGLHNLGIKF